MKQKKKDKRVGLPNLIMLMLDSIENIINTQHPATNSSYNKCVYTTTQSDKQQQRLRESIKEINHLNYKCTSSLATSCSPNVCIEI